MLILAKTHQPLQGNMQVRVAMELCQTRCKFSSAGPLPSHVVLEVTETEPGFKGNTATGATKPATVETGYTLNVPLFINEEDKLRIDTRTGDYVERSKD